MIAGKAAAERGYRIIGPVVARLENQLQPATLEKLSHAWQAWGYHALVFLTLKENPRPNP